MQTDCDKARVDTDAHIYYCHQSLFTRLRDAKEGNVFSYLCRYVCMYVCMFVPFWHSRDKMRWPILMILTSIDLS